MKTMREVLHGLGFSTDLSGPTVWFHGEPGSPVWLDTKVSKFTWLLHGGRPCHTSQGEGLLEFTCHVDGFRFSMVLVRASNGEYRVVVDED